MIKRIITFILSSTQMANIELLLNQRIAPLYVEANGVIYAAKIITVTEFKDNLWQYLNKIYEVIKIFLYALRFIVQQLYTEIYKYFYNHPFTAEKILIIFTIYCGIFLLFALNNISYKVKEQKEKINLLEKQIQILDLLKNDCKEVLSDEIEIFTKQTNIKYSTLDKKIKKIERDLKELE